MASTYLQKFPVPENFPEILNDFLKNILKEQPQDIIEHSYMYFKNKVDVSYKSSDRFLIFRALKILKLPLRIIMENRLSIRNSLAKHRSFPKNLRTKLNRINLLSIPLLMKILLIYRPTRHKLKLRLRM